MPVDPSAMYQLPWSATDNPAGWVEVTDACDLTCPGCHRGQGRGHVPLTEVMSRIQAMRHLTNCDRVAIAGGEPLLYPDLPAVVAFIASLGLKPLLLTHGEQLTYELACQLRKAGLVKFHFHVDSGMQRPGWRNRTEADMNALRQHFADLVFEAGGMQCGFEVTVTRASLRFLPDVVEWSRRNLHKVQRLALVAAPLGDGVGDPPLTAEEMHETLAAADPLWRPCVYVPGRDAPAANRVLLATRVGSRARTYGYLGRRAAESVQAAHHLWTGRYLDFARTNKVGRKVFLLAALDNGTRAALGRYAGAALANPLRLFDRIYTQSIALAQPDGVPRGGRGLCPLLAPVTVYLGPGLGAGR